MSLFKYINGIAGTGKSFRLKEIHSQLPSSTVLTSTTGISAVNMGGEAITINSLLWFYDHTSLVDNWTSGKLDYRLSAIYNKMGVRHILTDEVSMMDSGTLSIMCLAIDRLNETLEINNKQPLSLTLAGDFLQLPPVSGDFAFESEHWEKFEPNTTILRKVYRQTDKEFIQALQWVREGDGKPASEYFYDNMHKLIDPKYAGTTLYPYNSSVDRQNLYRLEHVLGDKVSFKSYRSGKLRPEWKNIPAKLELKLNSLVMILANSSINGELVYCNGDLGTLESVGRDTAFVKLQRNGNIVEVKFVKRLHEDIVGERKKVVGRIEYLPLRLAFASTIHKSQGLTLDSTQIDIRPKFFRECPGLLYVALSRCRTKAGLRIIGSPKTFIANCKVNPKVERFL